MFLPFSLFLGTPGRVEELGPVDLDHSQQVLQGAKPIAGVGPRGRPGHHTPLSKGAVRGSEAQGTWENFPRPGRLYLGGHIRHELGKP